MSRTHRDIRAAKRKRDMVPHDYFWASREPSWWHQMTTHVPARARLSLKMHAIQRGAEDDGDLPDHRKPHVYYW